MKVQGTLNPLHDKVFVSDMEFGEQKTASGIFIPSDNAKSSGVHPRWGRVFAIGPDQKHVAVGEWVLVEHGRWTRTVEYQTTDGAVIEIRMVDNDAILVAADEKPSDVDRTVMGHFNLNV
jgi:co-chaperonin GroES (HSP10)